MQKFLNLYITEKVFNVGKSNIQNNIRRLRFEHDEMTQQELADLAGVTRQAIISIEKGKYSPSLELAFRIAHAFNVSIEEVFTYEGGLKSINKGE